MEQSGTAHQHQCPPYNSITKTLTEAADHFLALPDFISTQASPLSSLSLGAKSDHPAPSRPADNNPIVMHRKFSSFHCTCTPSWTWFLPYLTLPSTVPKRAQCLLHGVSNPSPSSPNHSHVRVCATSKTLKCQLADWTQTHICMDSYAARGGQYIAAGTEHGILARNQQPMASTPIHSIPPDFFQIACRRNRTCCPRSQQAVGTEAAMPVICQGICWRWQFQRSSSCYAFPYTEDHRVST
ncbi:hypothetical protein V8C44DRAFT_326687 [Trichoderma aethiopicum]